MADLVFKYGTMGSSKTAMALMLRFSYIENGKSVLFLKPRLDSRDGSTLVKSRIGISAEALTYDENDCILDKFWDEILDSDIVVVDEVQFSTKKQIEDFKTITEELNKPVITFGLRTDFQTNLWEGSKRLFELATVIEELNLKCRCGNSAIVNARFNKKGIVYEGKQLELGSNDKYRALCYACWKKGDLFDER